MTSGEHIRAALVRYMDGELELYDAEPGYCLRVTRQIVMAGLELSYDDFYKVFHSHPVEDEPEGAKWARSAMRSLREQGRRVAFSDTEPIVLSEVQPGDIFCNHRIGGPIGHIGVIFSGGLNATLVENTSTKRGTKISGYNRLGRLDEMPYRYAAEIFRL